MKQQNQLLKIQMSSGTIMQTPTSQQNSSKLGSEHLRFLNRDLSGDEVISCEKVAEKFLIEDNFEIEIHNLNEVNEYFRIFKDQILALKS